MLAILEAEIEAYHRHIGPPAELQWTTWTSPSGSTELPLPVLPELPLPPGFEELFGDLEPASAPWASAEGSQGGSGHMATLPRSRGFITFEPQQVMQPVS